MDCMRDWDGQSDLELKAFRCHSDIIGLIGNIFVCDIQSQQKDKIHALRILNHLFRFLLYQYGWYRSLDL